MSHRLIAAFVVALVVSACAGSSPTGPSSPSFTSVKAQNVHFECQEFDGWYACWDTDPPAPEPPTPPITEPDSCLYGVLVNGVCIDSPQYPW